MDGWLGYYTFQIGDFAGKENVIISATGYTGSGGFEIYFKNEDAVKMIGIREYHVVIPAAKDSKSLGKCLREVFEGSDVPLQLS